MLRPERVVTDYLPQQLCWHQHFACELMARGLLRLAGSVARSSEAVQVVEESLPVGDQDVVSELVNDGEPDPFSYRIVSCW